MVAPLALALLFAQTASGATQPKPCDRARSVLPVSLAGWEDVSPTLMIGKALVVSAADPTTIRGLRAGELARRGGAALVPFEVAEDATYRVALSDGAWVDVSAGNMVSRSSAHAHGPACSGIRKIVDFPLRRGRYALHITGISTPNIRVLIAKA